jgi:hypothetical protein
MRTRALLGITAALGLLLTPVAVFAQEKKDQPTPPPKAKAATDSRPAGKDDKQPGGVPAGEMTPEMKAAMEAMLPGPAHEKLAKLAGEWTTRSKLAVPGQPPEETEGTSKIAVVMDGRFIHQEDSGTMMGMPVKSAKLMGFNNGSKKYEAVWTYSLGTNMMTMTGTSDDGGKTIKCSASFDNEMGVKETLNVTYKLSDDDHFTVVLDGGKMPDGTPGPTMETTYTRKK